jgi:hypothetical protein
MLYEIYDNTRHEGALTLRQAGHDGPKTGHPTAGHELLPLIPYSASQLFSPSN